MRRWRTLFFCLVCLVVFGMATGMGCRPAVLRQSDVS